MSTVMITSVSWTPRGQAKPLPIVAEAAGVQEDGDGLQDPSMASSSAAVQADNQEDIVATYGLDQYDEEDDVNQWGTGTDGLMYHRNNEEDPYITAPDFDNEELEDFMIRGTDDIILSAVMEEDGWSHLDVCILPEAADAELYVHHEYPLASFPLCVAWVPPNAAAVGTFLPEIELWDLNVVESSGADAKLEGHRDAVLGLAAHPLHHQMLASASADSTVKLWDIATQQCVTTLEHHKTKVQSLAWSPANASTEHQGLLASGGFDQRSYILDVRQPKNVTQIKLEADVEALRWISIRDGDAPLLFISTEAGDVVCYDLVAGKRRWTLSAHAGTPCSSISLYQHPILDDSPSAIPPLLLATCTPSTTSPLKLWTIDVLGAGGPSSSSSGFASSKSGPSCIYQKTNDFGKLHSVAFAPERPFHLAIGGHLRNPQVFNCLQLGEVQRAFAHVEDLYMPASSNSIKPMRSQNDADGDSDEGGMDVDESDAPPKAPRSKAHMKKYLQSKVIDASRKRKH